MTGKHILKKIGGIHKEDHYMCLDEYGVVTFLLPEYVGMSRGNATSKGKKCGIGAGWLERYKSDVFPSDEVPVPGHGVMKGVPRYYDEILREEDPKMYEEVKRMRIEFLKAHSDEFTPDRLLSKHKCKLARAKLKERKL